MTKRSVRGEFNSFVKGFITEASPLNFPEQACKDISNFVLNKDGTLNRRLGFDVNRNQFINSFTGAADNIVTYVWEEPASISDLSFLVIATEAEVRFIDIKSSPWVEVGTLSIFSTFQGKRSSFTSIDGRLIMARSGEFIDVITYDPVASTFSAAGYKLRTRDIWGIHVNDYDTNPAWRPVADNQRHRYNLYNNGWATQRLIDLTTPVDPAQDTRTNRGFWPAEIDTVWTGVVTEPIGSTPSEVWRSHVYAGGLGASAGASRGHFIIDLLNRGATRRTAITASKLQNPAQTVLDIANIPDDATAVGARVVCEHAGRVFYSGFGRTTTGGDRRSPDLSTFVAFSQLVNNISDLAKCYQDGDPTSRDASDVVDTDGGLIRISGAAGINSLLSMGRSLLVFAANGVWNIEGGADFGFTATNYKVEKVSDFGCISGDSVVSDGSSAYFWGASGIFFISRNQFGDLVVSNITDSTIASYYEKLTPRIKEECKGVYDLVSKKVRWLFPKISWINFTAGTEELVLDTILGSFSRNEIPNLGDIKVFSSFSSEVTGKTEYLVVNNVDLGGPVRYTIGSYKDTSFRDWVTLSGSGVDAKAYLETGAITASDSSVHKQTPVLVLHMKRTEDGVSETFDLTNPSGVLIRTSWDFASSAASNKISPMFQGYRLKRIYQVSGPGPFDNGFELMTSRNKLRGRGRALSIYMESEPGKDCKIVGWNLSMNGNTNA